MSIKEIKSGTLYKEFSVEIPYNEIDIIIDKKIKEIIPTVALPGFRKGKAPLNIVRKKYEDNILSEVIEKLLQDKTKNLIDKKNLKPFVKPSVNLKKYEKNQPLEVEIKINLEKLEKLITHKTSLIIINNPNNPTGSFMNKNKIDKLVAMLEKYPMLFYF